MRRKPVTAIFPNVPRSVSRYARADRSNMAQLVRYENALTGRSMTQRMMAGHLLRVDKRKLAHSGWAADKQAGSVGTATLSFRAAFLLSLRAGFNRSREYRHEDANIGKWARGLGYGTRMHEYERPLRATRGQRRND